ncbi:MAG: putative glycosyltransferase/methyltransferase [Nocardioides sp.]|jgi:glycosyltransferase involved in cell wall biosynthesis|nr:putative glycosyltransferase/methyltransferase [Nocardioides sp.]
MTEGTRAHSTEGDRPRVGVLVVAFNASTTLEKTLSRLPSSFAATVDHVLVCDDASADDTYEAGLRFQQSSPFPITVVRHEQNLGYGGNQKAGYRWAIEHGLDAVVLLHGDGQYAPELIEDLVRPLLSGDADAVFGSRMIHKGAARSGGMPIYKYVGNRILTRFQNALTGQQLTEWHSGYRAYRTDALADLDLTSYSDGFDFDTEIILGLVRAHKRILEVPIPTYYGDEICYVNGVQYARDVTTDVVRHWASQRGFGGGMASSETDLYEFKATGSHGVLLKWLNAHPPLRVLDAGCFDGRFADLVRRQGHHVTGLDRIKHDGVADRVDAFIEADLNQPLPAGLEADYDVIVAGDILEHVMEPQELLADLRSKLRPGGELLLSVPNFGHWYPRGRTALGKFDYDQRGPLDRGHIRFFTRTTIERLIDDCGLVVHEARIVGTPVDSLLTSGTGTTGERALRRLGRADELLVKAWPRMFGYQFLYRLGIA